MTDTMYVWEQHVKQHAVKAIVEADGEIMWWKYLW